MSMSEQAKMTKLSAVIDTVNAAERDGVPTIGMPTAVARELCNSALDRTEGREEVIEECARVCDREAGEYEANRAQCEATGNKVGQRADYNGMMGCAVCAKAIRSLKSTAPASQPVAPEGERNAAVLHGPVKQHANGTLYRESVSNGTAPAPAEQDGLPEEVTRFDNDGYMCEDGVKPKFVLSSEYDTLLALATRLRGERDELHGVMKFLVDTVHKAMEKSRGR